MEDAQDRTKNSMNYWYPKIKNLLIYQPKTEFYRIPDETINNLIKENMKNLDMDAIKAVASKIGYPLFLRTDQASYKHNWENASFVKDESALRGCIEQTIEFNLMADIMGLPFNSLVFREYIPMMNLFNAFRGKMPVNPEIRYFIRDGEVICWHWYWIKDAIQKPSCPEWGRILNRCIEQTTGNEILWLEADARKVARAFAEGYWSVDFCRAKDGRWVLIDMAQGKDSWHPECKFKKG